MTDRDVHPIVEGLLIAMRAEHEGYHFYMMAAQTTQDPKGKSVFEQLAREELDHVKYLKRQHEAVLKTGKIDPNIKLGQKLDLTGPSPIFSEDIRARLGGAHYEMTALSVGIQLELSARNHYSVMATKFKDPEVKAFYEGLAKWETDHYRALLAQQESLQDDYWQKNDFAPF